jgi:hypothetical protein
VTLPAKDLAGACHSFDASLDLQFVEDIPNVPFRSIWSGEEPLADGPV